MFSSQQLHPEGKVQEAKGKMMDDNGDQAAGKAKQAEGQARNTVEDIKDTVRDIFNQLGLFNLDRQWKKGARNGENCQEKVKHFGVVASRQCIENRSQVKGSATNRDPQWVT